jgi:hypothetical protein
MKIKLYKMIEMAVDQGIGHGLNRAFKHTDQPTRCQMHTEIEREVMNSICEFFVFDTPED